MASQEVLLELRDHVYMDIVSGERGGLPILKTIIDNKWVDTGDYIEVRSPINNRPIALVSKPNGKLIEEALENMHVRGRWSVRDLPGDRRLELLGRLADIMRLHRDDLVEALVVDTGKTYSQARGEVDAAIERISKAKIDLRRLVGEYIPGDWSLLTLESEGIVRKEPYGIVLAITPFNYPLFDTVNKFVYSFVAGNAVLMKPSSLDPIAVILFARLLGEAGFPPHSYSLLTVSGSELTPILQDRRIGVISFTGSTETGLSIMRAGGIKKYIMELGGGDPAIVLSDADLDHAAGNIAVGLTAYAGQRCDAIKLILVAKDVYSEFKDLLVSKLSNYKVGDPRCPATSIGPLITPEAADRMMNAVKEAVDKGGSVIYGGRRLGETYVEPTLIEVADKDKLVSLRLYSDEIFAPVALIAPIENIDEAIKLVNNRRYGLDAAIFGRDVNSIRKLIRYLEVGAIYVNEYPRHGIGYYPFGGRKDSGIGREGIGYSIEEVTAWKTIVYNYRGKGVWRYLV
jgi:glyceraldehyde-3-phosphate dehydrogenase [NAD(P)+]